MHSEACITLFAKYIHASIEADYVRAPTACAVKAVVRVPCRLLSNVQN